MKPLPEDRHRSPFVFAMLFSDLLPQGHVSALLDAYAAQTEIKLTQLNEANAKPKTPGEEFASGFGRAIYEAAMLDYLHAYISPRLETPCPRPP